MVKKFYQKALVETVEEAFIILKNYIEGEGGEDTDCSVMDMHMGNLFTTESVFGRDKVDTSFCFLMSDELGKKVYDWIEWGTLSEISSHEGLDSVDEDAVVKSLYEKFVGSSNMDSLYEEDCNSFGEDEVSWYKEDVLFKKFRDLGNQ